MIVGIDPGKGGGIASLSNVGTIRVHNCPEVIYEMADILYKCRNYAYIENEPLFAAIEFVHAFPTDSASSAFKFGTNYGLWLGILETLRIPYVKVSPQRWMRDFQPLSKDKRTRKKELKEIAKDIYPKATLKTADAILIAVWSKNDRATNSNGN